MSFGEARVKFWAALLFVVIGAVLIGLIVSRTPTHTDMIGGVAFLCVFCGGWYAGKADVYRRGQ